MLGMDRARHEMTIRREHEAAEFAAQGIAHAGRDEDLLYMPSHALTDDGNAIFRFLRPIRDAHAAGEVDVRDMAAGFLLQLHRELERMRASAG